MSSDPLLAASSRIVSHMNKDHADACLMIVQHYAELSTAIKAIMTNITNDTLTFDCYLRDQDNIPQTTTIPINPPLVDTTDARKRLVAMTKEASVALNRPISIPSPRFRFVHPLAAIFVIVGMTLLGWSAFLPAMPISALEFINDIAYFIFRTRWALQLVFSIAVAFHVAEAIYVACVLLDKKHIKGKDRYLWVLQTLLFGWPSTKLILALPEAHD